MPDHIFIALSIPAIISAKKKTRKASTTTLHFSQLSVFAGWNFLVTIHQGDLQPLNDLFQQCKQGNSSQKEELMGKTSGYLLHTISRCLGRRSFSSINENSWVIFEDIEDAVFDDKVEVVKGNLSIEKRNNYTQENCISTETESFQP